MTASPGIRFHHVANGTSTTMTIEAAGIPGTLSIWADPLHDGPVPGGLTDDELLEVRNQHLCGSADGPAIDPGNDLRQWRAAIERVDAYDELVLWYEHDLFCQLNLIQLLPFIRDSEAASKAVSLVCIGSFPGRPQFKGLGELTPEELAPLLGQRQRVTDAQHSVAARAWRAFRHSSPEALEALLETDTSALPFLARALKRFLEEYPSARDGLSRTERRLLTLAAPGPLQLATAFPRLHETEDAYYITDTALMDLADTLSSTSPPLVTCDRAAAADRWPLAATVTVTDNGRAVLNGEQDRVATCGIDRWLGGVHLEGKSGVWRWDEERQRIART